MFDKIRFYFESKKALKKKIEMLQEDISRLRSCAPVVNNVMPQNEENWHLIIDEENKETWIKPKRVSFVSPIELSNDKYTFMIIIEGNRIDMAFKDQISANEFRNLILNVTKIPEANTYESKKEPFLVMKEIEAQMNSRKRITQEDIDSMTIANKQK